MGLLARIRRWLREAEDAGLEGPPPQGGVPASAPAPETVPGSPVAPTSPAGPQIADAAAPPAAPEPSEDRQGEGSEPPPA